MQNRQSHGVYVRVDRYSFNAVIMQQVGVLGVKCEKRTARDVKRDAQYWKYRSLSARARWKASSGWCCLNTVTGSQGRAFDLRYSCNTISLFSTKIWNKIAIQNSRPQMDKEAIGLSRVQRLFMCYAFLRCL